MFKTLMALLVVFSLAGPAVAVDRSAGQVIDDAKIAMPLKSKLVADKAGNLTKTNVTVRKGVVTLEGTVNNRGAEDARHRGRVAPRH